MTVSLETFSGPYYAKAKDKNHSNGCRKLRVAAQMDKPYFADLTEGIILAAGAYSKAGVLETKETEKQLIDWQP